MHPQYNPTGPYMNLPTSHWDDFRLLGSQQPLGPVPDAFEHSIETELLETNLLLEQLRNRKRRMQNLRVASQLSMTNSGTQFVPYPSYMMNAPGPSSAVQPVSPMFMQKPRPASYTTYNPFGMVAPAVPTVPSPLNDVPAFIKSMLYDAPLNATPAEVRLPATVNPGTSFVEPSKPMSAPIKRTETARKPPKKTDDNKEAKCTCSHTQPVNLMKFNRQFAPIPIVQELLSNVSTEMQIEKDTNPCPRIQENGNELSTIEQPRLPKDDPAISNLQPSLAEEPAQSSSKDASYSQMLIEKITLKLNEERRQFTVKDLPVDVYSQMIRNEVKKQLEMTMPTSSTQKDVDFRTQEEHTSNIDMHGSCTNPIVLDDTPAEEDSGPRSAYVDGYLAGLDSVLAPLRPESYTPDDPINLTQYLKNSYTVGPAALAAQSVTIGKGPPTPTTSPSMSIEHSYSKPAKIPEAEICGPTTLPVTRSSDAPGSSTNPYTLEDTFCEPEKETDFSTHHLKSGPTGSIKLRIRLPSLKTAPVASEDGTFDADASVQSTTSMLETQPSSVIDPAQVQSSSTLTATVCSTTDHEEEDDINERVRQNLIHIMSAVMKTSTPRKAKHLKKKFNVPKLKLRLSEVPGITTLNDPYAFSEEADTGPHLIKDVRTKNIMMELGETGQDVESKNKQHIIGDLSDFEDISDDDDERPPALTKVVPNQRTLSTSSGSLSPPLLTNATTRALEAARSQYQRRKRNKSESKDTSPSAAVKKKVHFNEEVVMFELEKGKGTIEVSELIDRADVNQSSVMTGGNSLLLKQGTRLHMCERTKKSCTTPCLPGFLERENNWISEESQDLKKARLARLTARNERRSCSDK